MDLKYTILFERAEEGGFIAHVPALNGLVTQGETLDEAREMARDAIKLYVETLLDNGDPIPEDFLAAQPVSAERMAISF